MTLPPHPSSTSTTDDVNRRADEYANSRPAVRELRAKILETVWQREQGGLEHHIYDGRLKSLRDQEARLIDSYRRGFQEGFQRGVLQGQIQACQQLLGVQESSIEELDQRRGEELEEMFAELRQRIASSEIDPRNLL